MSQTLSSPSRRRLQRAQLAIAAVVVAALAGACVETWAQSRQKTTTAVAPAAATRTAVDLEQAFWACDYAATNDGLSPGDAMQCSVIAEGLKASRFNGDFGAMLAWWLEHKDAAHETIAAASRAGARQTPIARR